MIIKIMVLLVNDTEIICGQNQRTAFLRFIWYHEKENNRIVFYWLCFYRQRSLIYIFLKTDHHFINGPHIDKNIVF